MNYREELMRRHEEEQRQREVANARLSARAIKTRRGLLLAGIITALLAIMVVAPMRFKAIAGEEVDPVEMYLASNVNESITDADSVVEAQIASQDSNSLMLFAESIRNESFENVSTTDKMFRVKYLIADGSLINEGTTINDIYASEESLDAFIAQFENDMPLLDPGADSLYYVAMIDTSEFNGYGQVVNANFAMNNDNGETISDVIFDKETGIAYVPKYYYDPSFQKPGIVTTDGEVVETTAVPLDDDGITEPAPQQEVPEGSEQAEQQLANADAMSEGVPAPASESPGDIIDGDGTASETVAPAGDDGSVATEPVASPADESSTGNEGEENADPLQIGDEGFLAGASDGQGTETGGQADGTVSPEGTVVVQGAVTTDEVNAGEEDIAAETQAQAETMLSEQDLLSYEPLDLDPTAEYFDENTDPAVIGNADEYVNGVDEEVADDLEAEGIVAVNEIPIQAQLLVSYDFAEDFTQDTVKVPVSIVSQRGDVRTSGITEIDAQMFDTTTTIPIVDVADAGKIDATDILVYEGGSDEPMDIMGANGRYDSETGSLVFAASPATLSSLKVVITTEEIMDQVIDTILQPEEAVAGIAGEDMKHWPEGQLTKLDTAKFTSAVNGHKKYDYDGHYAYIAWHGETDRAIYASAPYMYSKPENRWSYVGSSNSLARAIQSGNQSFASVMNLEGGLQAQSNRGSIQDAMRRGTGGTLTGGFSLPGDAGNGQASNKVSPTVGGLDLTGIGSLTHKGTQKYMMAAGTCAHISMSVNKGGVYYSWGRIRMRPLYIDTNCAEPYVVIGFVTYAPSSEDQSYTGVYKFLLNKKVEATLVKESSNKAISLSDPNTYGSFAGATFGVYKTKNEADAATEKKPGNPVVTFTTKKDGTTSSKKMNPGTYWVRELTAPKNYHLAPSSKKIEVKANGKNKFTFPDDPIVGNWVKLKKTSSNTGITNGNKFYAQNCQGAVFGVYATKGEADKAAPGNEGKPITKLTVGADGMTNEWDVMTWKDDKAQKYNRSFFLKEIKVPTGYKANTSTIEAKVHLNEHVEVTASDEPETVSIKAHKRDIETGQSPKDGTFVFALCDENKKELSQYGRKTSTNGADVEWTGLPYGLYYVKEVSASYPYMVNQGLVAADVRPTNKKASVTVNVDDKQRRGTVSLVKTDAVDGNALAGATFTLKANQDVTSPDGTARHKGGEVISVVKKGDGAYEFDHKAAASATTSSLVTKADGSLTVSGLYLTKEDTTFQFEETATVDGHVINKTPVILTIKKDETKAEITASGTLTNEINSIDIYKKALKDDSPIEGVTMALWNSDNDLKVEKGTDESRYDSIAIRTPGGSSDYKPVIVSRTGSATVSVTGVPEGYLLVGDTDASAAQTAKEDADAQAQAEAQVQAEATNTEEADRSSGFSGTTIQEANETGFKDAGDGSKNFNGTTVQEANQAGFRATPVATNDNIDSLTPSNSSSDLMEKPKSEMSIASESNQGESQKDSPEEGDGEKDNKVGANEDSKTDENENGEEQPSGETNEQEDNNEQSDDKASTDENADEKESKQTDPLDTEAGKHLFTFRSSSSADSQVSIKPGVYHIRLIDASGNVVAEATDEQGIIGDASHASITVSNNSIQVSTEKVGNQGLNATVKWDADQNAWTANNLVAGGVEYNVEIGGHTVKVIKTSDAGGKTHYGRYSTTDNGLFAQGWLDQAALPKSDANVLTKVNISGKEYAYGTVTDADGHIHIDRLPFGDYTLVEAKPAISDHTAYLVDTNAHHFNVQQGTGLIRDTDVLTDGYHEGTEGAYAQNQKFLFKDDVTKLRVSKREVTGGPEIEGATLTLTSYDNNDVIDEWVSTTEPHYIEGLKPGTYWLIERMTPNNYDQAEAIKFTVLPTGEIQHTEMLDSPITIDAEIDKRQEIAKPLDERHMENGDGKNSAAVTDSPYGYYDYSIDFRSNSNTWTDEFTVEDPLDVVTDDMARVVSISTPQAWQDYDGKMNVWYKTNKTTSTKESSKPEETQEESEETSGEVEAESASEDALVAESVMFPENTAEVEGKAVTEVTVDPNGGSLTLWPDGMDVDDRSEYVHVNHAPYTVSSPTKVFNLYKGSGVFWFLTGDFTRDGYTFKGLYTEPTGGDQVYGAPTTVQYEGRTLTGIQATQSDAYWKSNGTEINKLWNHDADNITLYAQWEEGTQDTAQNTTRSNANATISDGHVNPWLSDANAMKNDANGDGRIIDYDGWQLWAADLPTMVSTDLAVKDLNLQSGEYVTSVRFEYGRVEAGFTTRPDEWNRELLKDEHDDLDDILSANSRSFENADVAADAAIKATNRIVDAFTTEASKTAEADIKERSETDRIRYEQLLKEVAEYNENRDAEAGLPERFIEILQKPAFEGDDDDATKIVAARDAGKASIQAAFTLDDTAEGRLALRKAVGAALSDIKGVVNDETYDAMLSLILEYDSCYLTNDPERYDSAKTNLVSGLCIILDKVAETGLAGRVHYAPAILHMQVTENYVPDKELRNSARVDAYRNGGGENLEGHDKDEVRQRAKERIMEIGTTLTADGGKKELYYDLDKTSQDEIDATEIEFIDTVSYSGLRPGVEYVMIGELHSKVGSADGGPITSNGKTVRVEVKFTPERESGTIEVPMKATVGSFSPNPVVAFEELRLSVSGIAGDQVLAEHKDIEDKAQTVEISMGASDEIISNPVRRIFQGTPLAQTGDAVVIIGTTVALTAGAVGLVLWRRRHNA